MAEIDDKSRALLDGKNFAHVATLREGGGVHTAIVWVDVQNGHVALNSAEGRVWPNNLRRDPRITVTVTNADNAYE